MQATAKKTDISEVWRRFKRSGDRSLRNGLMEMYYPIVKYNAERIRAKLPDEVDGDDLVSAGIFGLMDAIEAFDLSRGGACPKKRDAYRPQNPKYPSPCY